MNENVNLLEILKDAPKGTKLWSPLCGECYFDDIVNSESSSNPICIEVPGKGDCPETTLYFTADGRYFDNLKGTELLLFPSKENRDWATFEACKPKHFEPYQKVLVPYCDGTIYKWRLAFYSHYDESHKHHITTDAMCFADEEVIAYEGNEDKLGKPVV